MWGSKEGPLLPPASDPSALALGLQGPCPPTPVPASGPAGEGHGPRALSFWPAWGREGLLRLNPVTPFVTYSGEGWASPAHRRTLDRPFAGSASPRASVGGTGAGVARRHRRPAGNGPRTPWSAGSPSATAADHGACTLSHCRAGPAGSASGAPGARGGDGTPERGPRARGRARRRRRGGTTWRSSGAASVKDEPRARSARAAPVDRGRGRAGIHEGRTGPRRRRGGGHAPQEPLGPPDAGGPRQVERGAGGRRPGHRRRSPGVTGSPVRGAGRRCPGARTAPVLV